MQEEGHEAGIKEIKALRLRYKNKFAIIAMSSRTDIAAKLECVKYGGDAFLQKPIDMNKLSMTISNVRELARKCTYRVLVVDFSLEQ